MTLGRRACSQHCLDLGAQAGKAPHRSPFLSLPCGKEKEERKLETIALCIVSCQKDKMVLGANKRPLRPAAFLLEGSLPWPLPLPSPARGGTTPVGVKPKEGHSDALRNASRHTSANTANICDFVPCRAPCSAAHAQRGVLSHSECTWPGPYQLV